MLNSHIKATIGFRQENIQERATNEAWGWGFFNRKGFVVDCEWKKGKSSREFISYFFIKRKFIKRKKNR